MTRSRLPDHLRPMSLFVHVRVDDGTMLAAFAAVDARGVRQSTLRVEDTALSHAQATLTTLVRALRTIKNPLHDVRVWLPDHTVVAMLAGIVSPRTDTMTALVADANRLLDERLPGAIVEHGRFHDLVDGLLEDDIWE